MSTPFTFNGALALPGTPGLPFDQIPVLLQAAYDSKAEFEYAFPSSSGTQSVNFGLMPSAGAKLVLVVYDQLGLTPSPVIGVALNGSSPVHEISPGGFLLLASPTPVAGITAMTISYTGVGKVRIWLLGL